MTRRRRATGFAALAAVCAILAASLAAGYGRRAERQLGALVPVVVAREALPADRRIGPRRAARALEVRRVPSRFVPPGALTAIEQAIGLTPGAPIPERAYLLGEQLELPDDDARPRVPRGRQPVELSVAGAAALVEGGLAELGGRVDVVVADDLGATGRGRSYIAAERVPLLDLRARGDAPTTEEGAAATAWVATLALTRREALDLIEAESFARQIRLLPRGRR